MKTWKRFWTAHWQYVVVIVFGVILTVGIWGRILQIPTGDDHAFHMMRLQSASRAWSNGQIVPQVDPDALDGFGYAYNLFYGPLVTYVTAALQFVFRFWPIAINLTLALCVILAGLIMCRTMKKISQKPVLALLTAVFYMASPYLLNNLYARMAVGEVVAFVAAPILVLGLYQLTVRDRHAARSIALSAALLILSHSLSAMIFAVVAALYVLLNFKRVINWENIWRMVLGVAVALGLTAFFTLPLIEAKMTNLYGIFDQGYSEIYFGANPSSMNDHRLHLHQLMVTDYGASADDGLDGESSLALGVVVWVALLGFWFARRSIKRKEERSFVTALYIISVLAILAALPMINWYYVPGILWQMQFPWRMLMVVAVLMSVVAGYTFYAFLQGLEESRQRIAAVLLGMLSVYIMIPVIAIRPDHQLESIDLVAIDPVNIGWEAEYAPMQLLCSPDVEEDVAEGYACSLARIREMLKKRGEGVRVFSGGLIVEKVEKDGLRMDVKVNNLGDLPAKIELPMIYYPGYEAELNGEKLAVTYSQDYGMVMVTVPGEAKGEIEVKYGMSFATQIGGMISVVTAGLGAVWLVISGITERRRRRERADLGAMYAIVDAEQDDAEMLAELEAESSAGVSADAAEMEAEVEVDAETEGETDEDEDEDEVGAEEDMEAKVEVRAETVVLPEPPVPPLPEPARASGGSVVEDTPKKSVPKTRQAATKSAKATKAKTATTKAKSARASTSVAKASSAKSSTSGMKSTQRSSTTKTTVRRAKASAKSTDVNEAKPERRTTTRVRTIKQNNEEE